jgi:hyperosmotically inducible protein
MNRNIPLLFATCVLFAAPAIEVAAAENAEKTGEYIDDAALTGKVKAALLKEKNLKSLPISVESTGGVVTLSGSVVSTAQIKQAEDVAKHVKGVKDVHNALKLQNDRG